LVSELVSTQWPPQYSMGAPPKHIIVHAPAVQPVPVGQVRPHRPQLAGLVWVSTQIPSQRVVPFPHAAAQLPAAHFSPAPHFVPHVPQLFGSVWRSKQPAPHAVSAGGHPHVPKLHSIGAVQVVPQVPQLSESNLPFTHCPPQRMLFPMQEAAHTPLLQTRFAPQVVPQVPQFLRSLWVLVQTPEQSTSGKVQVAAPSFPVPVSGFGGASDPVSCVAGASCPVASPGETASCPPESTATASGACASGVPVAPELLEELDGVVEVLTLLE
jgi:hypothetical protein